MADIKIGDGKTVFTDDGLEVGSSTRKDNPEEYVELDHDSDDAIEDIGKGSKLQYRSDSMIIPTDDYFEFPYQTSGRCFVSIGDAETGQYWADFIWDTTPTVTILDSSGSSYIADSSTGGKFCIYTAGARGGGNVVRLANYLGYAVRVVFNAYYSENVVAPSFQMYNVLSGVDNLDENLTINGATETPFMRYKGGDADGTGWNAWGYGEDVALQAGTAPTYNQGSPLLGSNDDSVKFNGGGYYKDSSNTANQVTTEDMVFEIIFKNIDETADVCATNNTNGYAIYTSTIGTGNIVLFIKDAGGNTTVSSGQPATNTWNHAMCFVNRDEASTNGSQWYINGVASGSGADVSAISGTLTNSVFTLGGSPTGTLLSNTNIALVTGWKRASWHQAGADGPAEWATIAKERFAKLCGYYPQIANGTYMPTLSERLYSAYLDKFEDGYSKLYYVGNSWIRMCDREDANETRIRGCLIEKAVENLFPYSEALSNWTKSVAGDTISDNQLTCPDGRTAAFSWLRASGSASASIYADVTLTAATYSFSVFAKPGNKNWILLYDTTVTNFCYFNVSTGAVGTSSANTTGYIEGPFYGGFYRCCAVFPGTAATHRLRIYLSDDGAAATSTGDGLTVNMYFWGAQLEIGDYMTSPIITASAAATRVKDQLYYEAGANVGGADNLSYTLACSFLFPNYTPDGTMGDLTLLGVSNGSDATERSELRVEDSAATLQAISRTAIGDTGVSTASGACMDNIVHTTIAYCETDSLVCYLDGEYGSYDFSSDNPAGKDRINIGMYPTYALQPNCLISNIRIYPILTTKE